MRPTLLFLVTLTLTVICNEQRASAQRFGGGGGVRGSGGMQSGGGMRGGGVSSGSGMSRPMSAQPTRSTLPSSASISAQNRNLSSANHAPSMSRVAPATTGSRQSLGVGQPAASARSNIARSPGSTDFFGTATAQSRTGVSSPSSFNRPTSDQLSNFLGTPSTSAPRAASQTSPLGNSSRTLSNDGPQTLPAESGQSKSITTDNGTTITVGGRAGSGTTAGGATVGGAVGGIKIETAGGDTIVRGTGAVAGSNGETSGVAAGSRTGVKTAEGGTAVAGSGIRAGTDGENSAVQGGRFAAGVDAEGNAAAIARGGYADSTGYRQGTAASARRTSDGFARVNVATGSSDNGVGRIETKTAIMGPNGNVVTAGRGATFVNGQFVGGSTWSAINGHYTHWGYFRPGYVVAYPNCWWPGKWALAATAWSNLGWAVVGPYCGYAGSSTYYDYGQNVTYSEGYVYYGDEAVATEEQYYQQAQQLADDAEVDEPAEQADVVEQAEEWLPLGVFAIASQAEQQSSDKVVQLAINQQGVLRGNYHDVLADKATPISGAADMETQRVALRLEGNDQLLVETGLYNLTNDECPVLVHFDAERREELLFVRLSQPQEN